MIETDTTTGWVENFSKLSTLNLINQLTTNRLDPADLVVTGLQPIEVSYSVLD